ncbi:MAG: hypothetical protein HY680_08450 [Chloroflexi bacterium]|nr:hypothetical protein [Chloroflexota bacterium]
MAVPRASVIVVPDMSVVVLHDPPPTVSGPVLLVVSRKRFGVTLATARAIGRVDSAAARVSGVARRG